MGLYPHIVRCEDRYELWIEGTKVATCKELLESVLLLVWAMTVFHQKHAKQLKKTTVFIERYVLSVHHPVKVPMVVSEMHQKLNQHY